MKIIIPNFISIYKHLTISIYTIANYSLNKTLSIFRFSFNFTIRHILKWLRLFCHYFIQLLPDKIFSLVREIFWLYLIMAIIEGKNITTSFKLECEIKSCLFTCSDRSPSNTGLLARNSNVASTPLFQVCAKDLDPNGLNCWSFSSYIWICLLTELSPIYSEVYFCSVW